MTSQALCSDSVVIKMLWVLIWLPRHFATGKGECCPQEIIVHSVNLLITCHVPGIFLCIRAAAMKKNDKATFFHRASRLVNMNIPINEYSIFNCTFNPLVWNLFKFLQQSLLSLVNVVQFQLWAIGKVKFLDFKILRMRSWIFISSPKNAILWDL